MKIYAYYLPQFHPIPENDEWWGKGFTEWTNVVKAKSLFRKHNQPNIPSELGFYDLRLAASIKAQANMAREHGVDGFCFWDYYFSDEKTLLDTPLKLLLKNQDIDIEFLLAWANHDWYDKTWKTDYTNNKSARLLIQQEYGGREFWTKHFHNKIAAFKDKRYAQKNDKLLFIIFQPLHVPDLNEMLSVWRGLGRELLGKDFYFVGHTFDKSQLDELSQYDLDAINLSLHHEPFSDMTKWFNRVLRILRSRILKKPEIVKYKKALPRLTSPLFKESRIIPTLIPNWDHTPRSGYYGRVLSNPLPKYFGQHVDDIFEKVAVKPNDDHIVFIKSWNEWGEGNYLEPDLRYGRLKLETLNLKKKEFIKGKAQCDM